MKHGMFTCVGIILAFSCIARCDDDPKKESPRSTEPGWRLPPSSRVRNFPRRQARS